MYTAEYRLLKEARESWNHTVCDELVYRLDTCEVALDFPIQITKEHLKFRDAWVECHLTFAGKRDFHYCVIVELCDRKVFGTDGNEGIPLHDTSSPVNGNSHVFVDVAEFIQSPKKMPSNCFGVRCIVRLKRFDNLRCLCGYTARSPLQQMDISLLQDREGRACRIAGSRIDFRQAPDQLVKRGTKTVEEVASNQGNCVRDVFNLHPEDMQLIFKVIFSEKFAGFVTEGSELFPQVFKMYLRPGCLEIGIGQIPAHDFLKFSTFG